ncbi:MAG TPA: hypothetical protein VEI97_08055 [bacterium]|nr:hypothetical protein [bacterium]
MSRLALVPVLLVLAGCTDTPTTPKAGTTSGTAAAARPRPDKEGLEWNHKELLDYLNSKGVGVEQGYGESIKGGAWSDFRSGGVMIQVFRYETADKAKEKAGLSSGDYHWGRFYFNDPGNAAGFMQKIKQALEG